MTTRSSRQSLPPALAKFITWFRRETGLQFRVQVLGKDDGPKDSHGCVIQSAAGHITIQLRNDAAFSVIEDAVIHELAHVIVARATHRGLADMFNQDHNQAWGVAYAKVYRMYHTWLEKAAAP